MNITTPIDDHVARAVALDEHTRLVTGDAPSILLDPTDHVLLATNPQAERQLGLGAARPMPLDPAMPAWTAIDAQIASPAHEPLRQHTLLFWTPMGPRVFTGTIETILRGNRPLIKFTLATGETETADRQPPAAGETTADDMATLREIARRIRAGTGTEPPAAAEVPQPPSRSTTARPPALDFRQPLPASDNDEGQASEATADGLAGDAVAKLAHELRTPLSAIVSLAEVMRDEQLGAMGNPRYKAYAADIHDSALHTLELVGSMLDPASRESGDDARSSGPRLDFGSVDLNALAHSSVSAMQPIADRSGVFVVAETAVGLPMLHADRRAVRQIILNVLSNALRYTPRGGTIALSTKLGSDGSVELAITDTGSGMRPVEIARALSKTPPAGPPGRLRVSGEHLGSGIGLPLVRELAEGHGGRLAIAAEPGRGTRVAVVFPPDCVLPP